MKKTGETFFLEVKHRGFIDRKDGKCEIKLDFLNDYVENWKGTKLLIIHGFSPYFFVIDLNDIKDEMCRKEQVDVNKWDYYWNFADINKGIKDIFPELSEKIIQKAIDKIPKK